jgi:8-oxo-dGTP pyrophosphatase MutT (NUDIX family)
MIEKIKFALKQIIESKIHPGPPVDISYRSACVFFLLFGEREPHLLAIQKSDKEGYPWRNQVALPGGHLDKEDSGPVGAVFRELEEELNITKDQVELLGSMGHFQTINSIDIEVFIGLWNGKGTIRFDSEEISRVLKIPLLEIIRIHKENKFHGQIPEAQDLLYPFKDVVIWGATARILHYFIELLYPYLEKNGELTSK